MNKKGSALLWTIAIIMVLEVTVAAALGISYSYYHRTVANHEKRQAYVTAKGVLQNIVKKINANNEDYLKMIDGIKNGDKITLTIDLPADKNIGTIEDAFIKLETKEVNDYDRDILTVSIAVDYDGYKKRINADLQEGKLDGVETWQLLKYYEEEYEQLDSINIRNAKETLVIANRTFEVWATGETQAKKQAAWFSMLESDYPNEFKNYMVWFKKQLTINPNYKIWGSNDDFRKFFFYSNDPGTFVKFEKDKAKNQELAQKLDKMLPEDLYIQPYFTVKDNVDSTIGIIYANASNQVDKGVWNNVYLIFNTEDGHWYYFGDVKIRMGDFILFNDTTEGKAAADKYNTNYNGTKIEGITMTWFDNNMTYMSKEGNKPVERWTRFKAKYMTPENRID